MADKQTAAKTVRAPAPAEAQAAGAAAMPDRSMEPQMTEDQFMDHPSPDQNTMGQETQDQETTERAATSQLVTPLFGQAAAENGAVNPAPTDADSLRGSVAVSPRPRRRRSTSLTAAKFALPIVALVTVGYLVYWWYIHTREAVITVVAPDKPSANPAMITVNNFKYSAADSQNRPYTITADSAAQPADKAIDAINLTRPQANFTLANNHWMTITAQNGTYHRNADTVDLNGNVTLDHDTGMTFHTSSAQIDMKAKVAAGSEPVQGQNATSEINSQGFRVLEDGNVIIFTGKTLLKLHGKGKDGTE